jgi:hypothetical protein
MKLPIPSIGVLTLSAAGLGCSDAHKLGEAYEDICKANCECPEALEDWNEVSNCKTACEGYSKFIEAEFADREDEPCKDIDGIIKDIKACAKESCSDIYTCLEGKATDLYECWPGDYYYGPLEPAIEQELDAALEQLPASIPQPLLRSALYYSLADASE